MFSEKWIEQQLAPYIGMTVKVKIGDYWIVELKSLLNNPYLFHRGCISILYDKTSSICECKKYIPKDVSAALYLMKEGVRK